MPPTGVLLQQGRRVAKLLLDSMALRFRLDSRGVVEADLISFGTSGGQTFGRYMVGFEKHGKAAPNSENSSFGRAMRGIKAFACLREMI